VTTGHCHATHVIYLSDIVTLLVFVTLCTRFLLDTVTLSVSVTQRTRYLSQTQCPPSPVSVMLHARYISYIRRSPLVTVMLRTSYLSRHSDPSCHCYATHKISLTDSDISDQCHATDEISPTVTPTDQCHDKDDISLWHSDPQPDNVTLRKIYLSQVVKIPVSDMLRTRYLSQTQLPSQSVPRYTLYISLSDYSGERHSVHEIFLSGSDSSEQSHATDEISLTVIPPPESVTLSKRYLSQTQWLLRSVFPYARCISLSDYSGECHAVHELCLSSSDSSEQWHATNEIFLTVTPPPHRSVSRYTRDISLRHSDSSGQCSPMREVSLSVTIAVSVVLYTSYVSQVVTPPNSDMLRMRYPSQWPPHRSVSRYTRDISLRHSDSSSPCHATHEISLSDTVTPPVSVSLHAMYLSQWLLRWCYAVHKLPLSETLTLPVSVTLRTMCFCQTEWVYWQFSCCARDISLNGNSPSSVILLNIWD
jgi:hypothetical protein